MKEIKKIINLSLDKNSTYILILKSLLFSLIYFTIFNHLRNLNRGTLN